MQLLDHTMVRPSWRALQPTIKSLRWHFCNFFHFLYNVSEIINGEKVNRNFTHIFHLVYVCVLPTVQTCLGMELSKAKQTENTIFIIQIHPAHISVFKYLPQNSSGKIFRSSAQTYMHAPSHCFKNSSPIYRLSIKP